MAYSQPQTLKDGPPGLIKIASITIVSDGNAYPLDQKQDSPESSVTSKDTTAVKHPYAIICAIAMVTAANILLNGLITVELPTLVRDLHLSAALMIW